MGLSSSNGSALSSSSSYSSNASHMQGPAGMLVKRQAVQDLQVQLEAAKAAAAAAGINILDNPAAPTVLKVIVLSADAQMVNLPSVKQAPTQWVDSSRLPQSCPA